MWWCLADGFHYIKTVKNGRKSKFFGSGSGCLACKSIWLPLGVNHLQALNNLNAHLNSTTIPWIGLDLRSFVCLSPILPHCCHVGTGRPLLSCYSMLAKQSIFLGSSQGRSENIDSTQRKPSVHAHIFYHICRQRTFLLGSPFAWDKK